MVLINAGGLFRYSNKSCIVTEIAKKHLNKGEQQINKTLLTRTYFFENCFDITLFFNMVLNESWNRVWSSI